jgi:hypothetical protein
MSFFDKALCTHLLPRTHCSPDNQLHSHLVTPGRLLVCLFPGFCEIDLQHVLIFGADFHAVAGDRPPKKHTEEVVFDVSLHQVGNVDTCNMVRMISPILLLRTYRKYQGP